MLKESYDVVVLGAGLAGHCAALAAADNGATVALLEKMAKPGGSTALSAGSFALAGTDLQRAIGIEDTPQGLAQELMKVAGGQADPKLIELYIEQQADIYAWLRARGVEFHKVSLSSGTSVPRTHPTNARQMIGTLHQRVLEQPLIDYFNETAAKTLLTVDERREVSGCEVEHRGHAARVLACRGVVIATGGFTHNKSLIQKFSPALAAAPAWGGEGNTGDGLTMAWELGADLIDMGYLTGTFGVVVNHYPDTTVHPGDELLLRMAMYRGGIAVNLNAERFADESQSYKSLGTVCLAQPRAVALQIFDQPIMDQSAPNPSVNDLKGALEKGVIRSAETLRALAETVGLDGEKLLDTVTRYNDGVAAGRDAGFGRTSLGGGFGKPVKIETPPFYAMPCSTVLLSTYCGLRIDTSTRVLNIRGQPIRRLFAAGETVGGFHAAGYMSGSSLGKAAIFGRISGQMAANAR